MGQEAYAMFPALAEMQARSQLMRAQAGQVGQDSRFAQQKYGQEQQALGVLGSDWGGPSVAPVPGGAPMPPQPGEASQPRGYAYGGGPFKPKPAGIRVPAAGGPAMQGPTNTDPSGGAPGSEDQMQQPGDKFLPQAAQPPPIAPEAAPHKWTPGPGEQYDTPDGSRPRSFAEVIGAMRKANPKADNATLARAAQAFLPWMTEDDQTRLREETLKTNTLIAEGNRDAASARATEASASREKIAADAQAGQNARSSARIAAANQRAADMNARVRDTVAQQTALAQQKIEQAGRVADANLKEKQLNDARLQVSTAQKIQSDLNFAINQANFNIQDEDQRAAFIEDATTRAEEALSKLRALPNPAASQMPAKPKSLPHPQSIPQAPSPPLLDDQSGRLKERNARRAKFGLKSLSPDELNSLQ